MIKLSGLTPLQCELCEKIWNMDSQQEVLDWFGTLPKSVAHEAYVMMQMILLAVMDETEIDNLDQAQAVIRRVQNQSL